MSERKETAERYSKAPYYINRTDTDPRIYGLQTQTLPAQQTVQTLTLHN
jgi:hypothetical protein